MSAEARFDALCGLVVAYRLQASKFSGSRRAWRLARADHLEAVALELCA